ncbi:MAG TPA: hypothetical protein VFW11_14685 [Cyclobacteriaceae bacterium]|nr:hypothetical protein [Cyclobacteriaceae bacterium]
MKAFENHVYLIGYVISNVIAVAMLWAALKNIRLVRLLFFMLFAWASWTNATIAANRPEVYLEYADLTFIESYRNFIQGWFSEHIELTVGFVAFCQALIAVAMVLRGHMLRIGAIGAIIFLLAIMPLGVGSGFPTTLIMAVAMFIVLKSKNENYLWKKSA